MSRFWSDTARRLTPYVPGEQPKLDKLVKLNTNESPYGPSPRAVEAIQHAASEDLRRYPDPNSDALKAALARYHSVSPAQVFVGNGSDEVLAHAFIALLKHAAPLRFPDITYSFYPVYCALFDIDSAPIALTESLEIDPADYATGGPIIFPNPNAPTGRLLAIDAVEAILAANPDVPVVVDEAYIDYGGESAIPLVDRHPNLLVTRTFSKSRALAGLRVGYAIGSAELIEGLERVKNSFNSYPLGRPAQAGAIASVEDEPHFRDSCARVIATRDWLDQALTALGFEVLPSAANFVFARHPAHAGATLAAGLREQAIIVRHFKLPRIDDYLRITIGTDEECAALVDALKALV
ncbi:histidinol-phosphate transaminase [Denitromonas ohlonensis]|jgi:histidinol-phosphate aminotransferase|uniref:Histidinol-phosphate aminotransferase n=2 Tax=Denitromonas TaxID=139331 RepID=A0A557RBD0_9RHOO|nr:histidinol-phosphate transaminase [Denitromonas ohlonensis]TVO62475.1 histidinol-phosphate transaminase [Denitromonas ohlonensis]TVO72330.1 histidinol-phosphate transaminase [Denitromonas ohlonensis]